MDTSPLNNIGPPPNFKKIEFSWLIVSSRAYQHLAWLVGPTVSCLIVSCLIVFSYRTVSYFVSCRAVYTLLNVSCRVVPYSKKNEHSTLKTRHETRHGTYHVPCLNRVVSLSCRIVRTAFSHGDTVLKTLAVYRFSGKVFVIT
jgi:hypothetical protein